jgi:hypothetical protein
VREEIEVVSDAARQARILEGLGMRRRFWYEKFRDNLSVTKITEMGKPAVD